MFIYGRTAAPTARLIENKTLFIENGNRRVNCASKYVIHFIALFTHAYLFFFLKVPISCTYAYLEVEAAVLVVLLSFSILFMNK